MSTKLKRNIPEVFNVSSSNNITSFKVKNINVSFINALRRTIISDIPTAVFRTAPYEKNDCNIIENTSRLNNEILKQRLSCIPIYIKDLDIIENLELEIDVDNTTESIIYVTTDDFKIKDTNTNKFLSTTEISKIFPIDPFTKEHIIFARLRPKIATTIPGEKIHLKCKISIDNANTNGAYNVVSTCAYSFDDDVEKQNSEWALYSKTLNKTKAAMEREKKNWFNHKAKQFYKPNVFNFIIETIGVFTNIEIIKKACKIIKSKLQRLESLYTNENNLIKKSISTTNFCYDIKLPEEDYTIGKILEYIIHQDFYANGPELSYIGFSKKHPHDNDSIIRLAFNKEENSNIESVRSILTHSVKQCINVITNIDESFG
jgi:DNA-directed RNA polymerase subunit L